MNTKRFWGRLILPLLMLGLLLVNFTTPVRAESRNVNPLDSSGFVVLSDVVPDIIQEIRYYSTYNFVGERITGYYEPCALMTKEAALALKEVSDELKAKGYRLKVYDAYRPQMAVDHFVRWAEKLNDKRMKPYFYPQVEKNRLFAEGYIDAKSGHSRGSTIDLTLFDMSTGKELDQYSLDHILYYHDFTNDAVFNDFFAQLWKETDASTNVDKDNIPVAGDRVLILSVCKNGDDNHRYLVVCKLVEDTDEINAANLAAAQEAALKAAQDAANQG